MNKDEQDYKWILERTTEAVRNIDSKNGIVTAILAVIAAILFSNEAFIDCAYSAFVDKKTVSIVAIGIAATSTVVVVFSLFASIFPRTKCEDESLIYAGGMAACKNIDKFKERLSDNHYSLEDDLVSQIYVNAKIYKTKAKWNRIATGALYVLITSIVVFSILATMGV